MSCQTLPEDFFPYRVGIWKICLRRQHQNLIGSKILPQFKRFHPSFCHTGSTLLNPFMWVMKAVFQLCLLFFFLFKNSLLSHKQRRGKLGTLISQTKLHINTLVVEQIFSCYIGTMPIPETRSSLNIPMHLEIQRFLQVKYFFLALSLYRCRYSPSVSNLPSHFAFPC